MNEKELRREIYKIIREETYSEGKTFQPTKKDLKRRPHCHPGFGHVVVGQLRAAGAIVKFLKEAGLDI